MAQKKIKRVITTKSETDSSAKSSRNYSSKSSSAEPVEFFFKKKNFIIVAGGLALMLIGFILMLGGNMPSPEVWDDSIIYNKRIIVLSPIFILSGLGVVAYSIFKR
jgi:hypothetical protein